ncbi:MAG TPA: HD domain-containing protein [Longimicrobiales bacterium]
MSPAPRDPPTIADWLAGEPFPWPAPTELAEGARVTACYCIESKLLARTRDGQPYLRLQLCDRSGAIEGRIWDDAAAVDAMVDAGTFVGIRGRLQSFRGQRQLKIEEIARIDVAPDEWDLFLPRSPHDLPALEAELDARIAGMTDAPLRTLLARLLGADTETGAAFRRAPAAKRNHHAYVGGLLEHTLSVARLCDALARHYGEAIDRELLEAGALLHDIGKIREIASTGGFPYTDEGKLLGHIILGIQMVREAAAAVPDLSEERRLLLLHLVASHQGKYEWQSPRIPMILEALILHAVDDLDAKFHQARGLIEAVERGWTRYDGAFGRDFFRHRTAAAPTVEPPGAESAGSGKAPPPGKGRTSTRERKPAEQRERRPPRGDVRADPDRAGAHSDAAPPASEPDESADAAGSTLDLFQG